MRPAEVYGWVMYPSRSSTVMSLRTVALDTPSLREPATRWDPTGSAVSTYSSTTARRIAALRSSRSIGSVDPVDPIGPVDPVDPHVPELSDRNPVRAQRGPARCSPVSTRFYRVPTTVVRLPLSSRGP